MLELEELTGLKYELLDGQIVTMTGEGHYEFGCNTIQLQGIPKHLTPVLKRCEP